MSAATAKVSKTIDASPEIIWQALTTPAMLKQFFLGADVDTDWKLGHPIHIRGTLLGKPFHDKGRILVFEPRKRLSFSRWSELSGVADVFDNYHVLSFGLMPQGNATVVTLTQSNLIGGVKPFDIKHRADYERNWQRVLDRLAAVVMKGRGTTTSRGAVSS